SAAGHKDKAGVLRLGLFRRLKWVIFRVGLAAGRTKDFSKAGEFVVFRIACRIERSAEASRKEEKARIFECNIHGCIYAGRDPGYGAGIAAIDAEALLSITDHIVQKIVFPLFFWVGS